MRHIHIYLYLILNIIHKLLVIISKKYNLTNDDFQFYYKFSAQFLDCYLYSY